MNYVSLFLLIIVFCAGCNQNSESITSSEKANSDLISNALLKPPAQSGPYVFRTETNIFGLIAAAGDERSGMTVFIGGDLAGACLGEPDPFDTAPLLEIDVPEDADRFIQLQKGEVRTSVYKGVFTGGSFCGFAFSHELIASGTSNLVLTDNDLLTFLTTDNKNANSFGWKATGQLTTPGGETIGFTGISRAVWDGVDFNNIRWNNKIILH